MNEELRMKNEESGKRRAVILNVVKNLFPLCAFCVLFLSLLSSCDRRDLTYYTEAEIEITADWSMSGLSETEQTGGATVLFYPQDGGTPKVVLMGDATRKTIRLREGRYDVILFNRSFNDFSGIAFRGESSYHSLEAYAKKPQTGDSQLFSGSYDAAGPATDELAADRMENFEVTAAMLGNYSPTTVGRSTNEDAGTPQANICRLHFTPRKLTKEITTRIHVKGLHNVRNATCTLGGVTASVFLASGKLSEQKVTQEFKLGNPVFKPGSFTEGTLSATFSVFGFDEELPHEVHFEALLVDGKTQFEEDLNIRDIEQEEGEDGTINITIELNTETNVPDVKPEDGSDSGFDVDVGGWGDDVTTDVPI